MVGEHLVVFLESIGVQFLNGLGNAAVDMSPPLSKQTVVGHLLSERIFEDVLQIGVKRLFIENLEPDQVG